MTSKVTDLDEVVVNNYSHINAYNLGIIPKFLKTLTPAERGKYNSEPRALEFEEKLSSIKKFEDLYDEEFLVQNLKIEKDMSRGFLFLCLRTSMVYQNCKRQKNFPTTFHLTMLAQKFNELRTESTITKSH